MKLTEGTREAIAVHQSAGRPFVAGGVRSFVREQGRGAPVVMVHGVPSSSFMYRKLIPAVASQGLRAIAFDLPGLGLAERSPTLDYSWSGLSSWLGEAIDELGIERCHLVVHDIGGPIGCEWAVRNPRRVMSLTVMNTMLNVATFKRPWSMAPFAMRGIGPLWLRGAPNFVFSELFYRQGVANRAAISRDEVYAYRALLIHRDGGQAFLKIMRGFELTAEKQRLLWDGLAERPYPTRIVWGERDPVLGPQLMKVAQEVLRVDNPIRLPAKHFLTEEQSPAIANAIADLAAPLG